jgi:ACS family allantoate permease-like MFS transporter
MAATKNFAGAMTVRFFLGLFEAAVTPGFALFTSQWYTIREQGFRTGIWFRYVLSPCHQVPSSLSPECTS